MQKGWQTREEAMGTKRDEDPFYCKKRTDRRDAEQMGPQLKNDLAGLSAPPNNLKPNERGEAEFGAA